MKNLFICLVAIFFFVGCKPTESGYKKAYEKTISTGGDEEAPGFTAMGHDLSMRKMTIGTDTFDCASAHVAITPGIGNPPAKMEKYNVVAGSFRQRFTASDMCQRLIDAGFSSAFVAQTGTPRYYVIASSSPDAASTAALLKDLRTTVSLASTPFILETSR